MILETSSELFSLLRMVDFKCRARFNKMNLDLTDFYGFLTSFRMSYSKASTIEP